jgi:hypothetical protein
MGHMREQHYFGTATGDQFLSSLFSADSLDGVNNGAAVDSGQMAESMRARLISKRLMELGLAFFEDFGRPLDSASTEAATAFFRGCPNIGLPAFSAEPSGHVLATWRKGREVLTVRFVDRGPVHFTLARNVADSPNLKRTWGAATRAELTRPGSPFEPLMVD